MEFGYDVQFPKIYDQKSFSIASKSRNNLLGHKITDPVSGSTDSKDVIKYHITSKVAPNTSGGDNRVNNLATIVPRVSTSTDKILEVDTFTKKSMSPYKNLKLPALTSNKNRHSRIVQTKKYGSIKTIKEDKSVYSTASKASKYSKKALDITHEINYNQNAEETTSLHELIILTLSQAFGAKPRQAAGLVPRDFKFLTVAVVKGKRKESTSIRKWYKMVIDMMPHLVDVVLNDNPQRIESQIYNILNILKIGIFSIDAETLKLAVKAFYSIMSEFAKTFYQGFFWEWMKKETMVLKAIINIFLDYPEEKKLV